MNRRNKKSRLTRTLNYWTRQMGRITKLLIITSIVILLVFGLVWILRMFIDYISGGV